jgi:hypothetical protein
METAHQQAAVLIESRHFSMSAICVLGSDTEHRLIVPEAEIRTNARVSWRFEGPMAPKGISTHVLYPILLLQLAIVP